MNQDYENKKKALGPKLPHFMDSAIDEVSDSLPLAWAAAQSVFGNQATPEHALTILEFWLNQKNHHHRIWHEMKIRDLNAMDQDHPPGTDK